MKGLCCACLPGGGRASLPKRLVQAFLPLSPTLSREGRGGKTAQRQLPVQPAPTLSCEGRGREARAAFVSTNSITQGEQVGVLWGWLLAQGMHIQFAHRTFSWSNEARGKAAVHCVIVGFGLDNPAHKVIYEYEDIKGEPHALVVELQ